MPKALMKADIIEAESLTGEKDIYKAAKLLNEMGPKEVVITHRNGIVVFAEGNYYEAIFSPKELLGRSGRGDTCIASYVASRLTNEPKDAIIWSAAVTSLKLEAEGPFNLGLKEIEIMISKNYVFPSLYTV